MTGIFANQASKLNLWGMDTKANTEREETPPSINGNAQQWTNLKQIEDVVGMPYDEMNLYADDQAAYLLGANPNWYIRLALNN